MAEKKERIFKQEFNELLKQVFPYNEKDRLYLLKLFESDLIDGLTRFELKEKLTRLRADPNDQINLAECERIKNKVLSILK